MPSATWSTKGGGTTLLLERTGESYVRIPGKGNAPVGYYILEEYTKQGMAGSWQFIAWSDMDAIAAVEDRVAAGRYTPTGAKNPPVRRT